MATLYEALDENYIKFESSIINVIIDNSNIPWFNANEIASSLGYTYPKDAISNNVDEEDKIKLENF